MHTPKIITETDAHRNATQAEVDDARAAGLHGIADELDSIRARLATLALRVWWTEGGPR